MSPFQHKLETLIHSLSALIHTFKPLRIGFLAYIVSMLTFLCREPSPCQLHIFYWDGTEQQTFLQS